MSKKNQDLGSTNNRFNLVDNNIQKPKAINNQKTDRSKTAPIETEFVKNYFLLIRISMLWKMKEMSKMNILIPIITIFIIIQLNQEILDFLNLLLKQNLI